MKTRTIKKVAALAIISLFLFTVPTAALAFEETKTLELTSDALDGMDELMLSFLLGGARISSITRSNDDDFIVKAVVTYDTSGPEPTLLTGESGDEYTARFTSGYEIDYINYDLFPQLQEWEITIGDYDVDTDLSFVGGGVKGEEIDLGGLPLRNCAIAMGGGDVEIDFSSPTTRQVENLNIEGGGLMIAMSNIGNTDFEEFNLIGGGIIANLDFQGALGNGEHEVNIISAGGTLDIDVPSDAGERVDVLAIGAAVSVRPSSQWRKSSRMIFFKNYRTTDYSSEDVRIDMDITAVGSIVDIDRD